MRKNTFCSKCAEKHIYAARNVRRSILMLLEMFPETHLRCLKCAQKHTYAARDVHRNTFMLLEMYMYAKTYVWCEIPGALIKKLNNSSGKQL